MPEQFFARSPDELASSEEVLAMTGLEFIQSMMDGRQPAPPINGAMGYKLQSVEKGRVVFRGAPQFEFCNPLGNLHGGWYGTLLDSSMACAVQTMLDKGTVYTTLEYKVNIIRPIPLGMVIDCEGIVDHVGRSTGISHGEIRGVEDGKLYATGTTTCIVMKMR